MISLLKKFMEKYFPNLSCIFLRDVGAQKEAPRQQQLRTGFRSPAPFARMLVKAGGETFLLIFAIGGMLLMDMASLLGIKGGNRFGDAFAAAGCAVLILSPMLVVVGGIPALIYLIGQTWHHAYVAIGRKLKVYVTLEQLAVQADVDFEWAGRVVKRGSIEPVDCSLGEYVTGKILHFAAKDAQDVLDVLRHFKSLQGENL